MLGDTHATSVSAIMALSSRPTAPPALPSPQAQYLRVATDELDAEHDTPDRGHVVSVLNALADALDVVAPQHPDEIRTLRATTAELGRPGADPKNPAGIAKRALAAANHALADAQPPAEPDRKRFSDAVGAMVGATELIDPQRSLVEQSATLRSVFHASVRAVYAATGAQPPEADPASTASNEPL